MTAVAIPVSGITLITPGATLIPVVGGATVASGAGVYRDPADSMEVKAVNVTAALSAFAYGILFQNITDGNGGLVVPNGVEIGGFTGLTKYKWYFFDTGGSYTDDPATDLASGEYVTSAFMATSTTQALVQIVYTGMTV